MNTYLQPFVEKANFLSTHGLTWKERSGESGLVKTRHHSLVIPTVFCVDSMCRCKLLNLKRPYAEQGYTMCHHETEAVINGHRKYTFRDGAIPALRTDLKMEDAMIEAGSIERLDTSGGIKGPTVMINLKYLNSANGIIGNHMHGDWLGQVREITNLLLSEVGEGYYIGDIINLAIIDERLTTIRVPKCITRTPRSILGRALWKVNGDLG